METPKTSGKEALSIFEFDDYRAYFRAMLVARIEQNPRFSLRAFAKFLNISAANLSAVLAGKRYFSLERVLEIADRLKLNAKESEYLELIWKLPSTHSAKSRSELMKRIRDFAPTLRAKALDYANFQVISDWKSFAVLCSFREMRLERDPQESIEHALNLKPYEYEVIRDRLANLDLIRFDSKTNRWVSTQKQVLVDGKKDQLTILRFHEQWLNWCTQNLRLIQKPSRYSASEWTTLDPESYEEAKQILSDALDQIQKLSANVKKKDTRVFGICLHLLQVIPKT